MSGESAKPAHTIHVDTVPVDTIHVDTVRVDTVIVGAGFGGLGMAIRLARQGESFVILERGSDIGGTWRDNTYPGVACDIPSHLYSFSFRPKSDWSRFFATGSEILQYLHDCVQTEDLTDRIRLHCDVLDMRWLDGESAWLVSTTSGTFRCQNLIVAAGRLSNRRMPSIIGLDSFTGDSFHSSQWPEKLPGAVALAGQRVGIVGSGASAVQLTPKIADQAASLVVFQRSAPYLVPRPDFAYSELDIQQFADHPLSREKLRADIFWEAELAFAERLSTPGFIDRLRQRALSHLHEQVPDATLREQLTPQYEIGCKRVVLSNDYYPSMNRPSVTLEPSALVAVEGTQAIAASAQRYELDVLIFATGFETTKPPFAERVFGRGGRSLADTWAGGMAAYASTTVAGFPNLFVIDGPNASLGHNSAVYMIEAQVQYILGALEFQRASGLPVVEVTAEAQEEYVNDLDRRSASTVWLNGGCESWYVDERSGRLTLLWPDFAFAFREGLRVFDPQPYRARGPVW